MIKKISATIIIVIGILIIFNLGRQILNALNAGKRLDDAGAEFSSLQAQNNQLKQELAYAQSYTYVEKTARDELNMAKPGETVIIIPKIIVDQVINAGKKPVPVIIPNWQGWLKLLFHI
jgi:cell division protein FtsB